MAKYEYKYCSSEHLITLITTQRKYDGLNIEQFLNKVDITYHEYRRIKSSQSISIDCFNKIIKYLGIKPKSLEAYRQAERSK